MIIGLGCTARVGKDALGEFLVREYGFQRTAFAESLKEACRHVFGFTDEQLHGDLKEHNDPFWGFSPRWALQFVGTECFRQMIDPDIWVKSVRRRIENSDGDWVVTDVRFLNEAIAIQSWGGKVIRIDRPGVGAESGISRHASETSLSGWNGWDAIVANDGTLENLYTKTAFLLESWR